MNFDFHIPEFHTENYPVIFLISNAVATTCTILVVIAIILDFVAYHRPKKNKRKKNSWVETGSMFVYFFVYFLLMKPAFGRLHIQSEMLYIVIQLIGMIFLIMGCYVNMKGRMVLKQNWANQVTIYHDHTLVTESVYGWVRHPLYASLIWMFIGGSLVYNCSLSLLSVFLIFIPMMYFRAKQEEELLSSEFSEYPQYKKRVGMFFPKII